MHRQLIIILLVALVLVLMTVQNPNPVSVQFLSWEAQQVPVIIIILISLLAGVIISSILGLIKQSKLKDKIRRLLGRNYNTTPATSIENFCYRRTLRYRYPDFKKDKST